jgi:hypothetical protein
MSDVSLDEESQKRAVAYVAANSPSERPAVRRSPSSRCADCNVLLGGSKRARVQDAWICRACVHRRRERRVAVDRSKRIAWSVIALIALAVATIVFLHRRNYEPHPPADEMEEISIE